MGEFVPVADLHKKTKSGFYLHWLNIGLIILMAAIWVFLLGVRVRSVGIGSIPPYAFGRIAGMFMGTILFSGLFAYIAYFIGKRSTRVGNIIFGLFMIVFGIDNSAKVLLQLSGGAGQVRELASTLKENNLEMYKQYQETGELGGFEERIAKTSGVVDQLAASKGLAGDVGRAVKKLLAEIKTQALPLEAATNRVLEMPQIHELENPDQLDNWIASYAEMGSRNREYADYYDSLSTRMSEIVKEEKFSGEAAQEFMQGFTKSANFELHRGYRESIVRFCEDSVAYGKFAKEHWGQWNWDEAEGTMIFSKDVSEEVVEKFVGIETAWAASAAVMIAKEEEFMKMTLR